MPLVFTFIMAPFAAGLLIYWAWSNILSILQQYVIMHRFKVENPIDSFIDRFTGKAESPADRVSDDAFDRPRSWRRRGSCSPARRPS